MEEIEKRIADLTAPVSERIREVFSKNKKPFEVYGLLSEFLLVKGKMLRPALCLAACMATHGKVTKDAIHAAAAVEMFHNFTLIHDDIEDASLLRRGMPCMHIKYGVPLALNAGDGLFMLVWRETMEIKKNKELAQKRLLDAFTGVLEGQAIELGWYWKNKWEVGREDYFDVVQGKTGCLIAGACEVGGIVGGASKAQQKALYDFGMGIGVGFQIMDDVLNIIGEEKKYGKEIGGDIVEGKRTLIVVRALELLGQSKKEELLSILKKKEKTKQEVERAILLLKESGGVNEAIKEAERRVREGIGKLDLLKENEGKRLLVQIADYITKRQR
ncbi:MAG: polyprenyl synthetase family protein [Candidatus Anstonellaceae archaeon]